MHSATVQSWTRQTWSQPNGLHSQAGKKGLKQTIRYTQLTPIISSVQSIVKEKRGRHRNVEPQSLIQSYGGGKTALRTSGILCHHGLGKDKEKYTHKKVKIYSQHSREGGQHIYKKHLKAKERRESGIFWEQGERGLKMRLENALDPKHANHGGAQLPFSPRRPRYWAERRAAGYPGPAATPSWHSTACHQGHAHPWQPPAYE